MTSEVQIELADAEATHALGVALGRHLRAGEALGLVGDLGAGKTTLVRGVAEGLGVDDPTAVQSPTYLLVVEHPGPIPLVHVDAYLPGKTRGFLADGGLDYLAERHAVIAVEWADRIADLMPKATLWITLTPWQRSNTVCRIAHLCDRNGAFPWLQKLGR